MAELKPCPFCGGTAGIQIMKRKKLFANMRFPYNTHYFYVRCDYCRATTSVRDTREGAENVWNRRAKEEDDHELEG